MSEVFLAAFVGDLAAFGINEALDVIAGQWGAQGLAVWACEPPTRRLYLADGEARCASSDGGATFEPRAELYRSTRMRPPAARDLKKKARFEDVLEACRARSLPVRAIVSASRMGRVCAEFPGAAARDVFDHVSRASTCLSNPDVAALVEAMVVDVSAREGVCAVEVSDLVITVGDLFEAGPQALRQVDKNAAKAMQACFCESCRQVAAQAGVDVDAAQEQARRTVAAVLGTRASVARGSSSSPQRRASADGAAAAARAYERRADASASKLAAALVRVSSVPLWLYEEDVLVHGMLAGEVIAVSSAAGLLRWPQPGAAAVVGSTPIQACVDGAAFIGAAGGGADLVRCCRDLTQAGYAGLTLHTFGQTPPALSDAVRQAIRIVRRE